ncbi:MAG: TetR/AcrR family transcriptional regulator [Fidelibacterota bacterium]|nr:MAG: TetR/AcrR family transcriptional regulator [Candidatus Neomarinimicrobiota bacterium]
MKREQIIQTAERLFARFGSRRVTVEELCREADVSKMTFYKYFANKVELVRTIRDNWEDEGFRKFDEINALEIPFPEKIDLMTQWKVEFAQRINADFIRELVSTDDAVERFKRRYLGNISNAQKKGEIRRDIDPEFLWLVVEKLGELFKEGSWKQVFTDPSQYQQQLRTLIWYGLLMRGEKSHGRS